MLGDASSPSSPTERDARVSREKNRRWAIAEHAPERLDRSDPSDLMGTSTMWVGKSIFTRTVQQAAALISPEIRSVQSSFRLEPKNVPFLTGQKGDGKSRTNWH